MVSGAEPNLTRGTNGSGLYDGRLQAAPRAVAR